MTNNIQSYSNFRCAKEIDYEFAEVRVSPIGWSTRTIDPVSASTLAK